MPEEISQHDASDGNENGDIRSGIGRKMGMNVWNNVEVIDYNRAGFVG